MNAHPDNHKDDDDDYESLIPSKYRDIDSTSFEKFRKKDDWD